MVPSPLAICSRFAKDEAEILGAKKSFIMQMVEIGMQIHHGTRITAEFLMGNKHQFDSRIEAIQSASCALVAALKNFFGADKCGQVKVDIVSSWASGVCKTLKDGRPRLTSTPVILESILGRSINMDDVNTVPYGPPGPDPYNAKAYTANDLAFGMKRFDKFVDGLGSYSRRVLDTNEFLFKNGSSALSRVQSKGYRIAVDMWDQEVVLLLNDQKKCAIYLARPVSAAADARDGIPIANVVKRSMTVQVTAQVVAWCQGDDATRGTMNCSFHDANFSACAFEHFSRALHFSPKHAAAMAKRIMTPPSVFAFEQNDLAKTHSSDPDYPIAGNLRKKHIRDHCKEGDNQCLDDEEDDDEEEEDDEDFDEAFGDESNDDPTVRVNNKLIIRRILNLVSFVTTKEQVAEFVDRANELLVEDKLKSKTLLKRFTYILERLKPKSWLRLAIESELRKHKKNRGNPTAEGKTKSQQQLCDNDLEKMKALAGTGDKFWVFLETKFEKQGYAQPGKAEKRGHEVFDQLVFEGVRRHLSHKDPRFLIHKITKTGRPNTASLKSANGAFVLCVLEFNN